MCSFGKWQRSNRGGEKSHAQAGFWTPCSHHERGIFPPHKNRFVIIFIFYTHHPPRRTQTCAGLRMRTKGLPVWPICANIISLSQKIFFSPSGCKNHPSIHPTYSTRMCCSNVYVNSVYELSIVPEYRLWQSIPSYCYFFLTIVRYWKNINVHF